jgi:ABC-type uncharacterized transport system ATPase subunit
LRDTIFSSKYVKEFFPEISFDFYNPSELRNISFRAFQGQLTAILSPNPEELRTIIDFLVNNRTSGRFNGEILLHGVHDRQDYNDVFAFVPKVCSDE